MKTTLAASRHPPSEQRGAPPSMAEATLWGASGALLATALSVVVALQIQNQRFVATSPWHMAKSLFHIVTDVQWIEFFAWATVTGLLLAWGSRRGARTRLLAWGLLAAGAAVPIGLLVVGNGLHRLWPDTTDDPTDSPLLALALVAYSLAAPWALGRLLARSASPR